MKLIIAGGRDFDDPWLMNSVMSLWVKSFGKPDAVLCGLAKGADTQGKDWADGNGVEVLEYPAAWRVDGVFNPRAGLERNTEMADDGTHCITFWDGMSTGTADMIKKARNRGLYRKTFYYNRQKLLKRLF